jgi:acyl transferase domain-containing protein
MRQIFGGRKKKIPDVALGSVKSMIGHCIPAAGAASIIKTAYALHEKILPPTLCDEINPELGLETTPFYVNTEARPWLHDPASPRRAAVNAFGFGGINSHLILEESPAAAKDAGSAFGIRRLKSPELFCFAAPMPSTLRRTSARFPTAPAPPQAKVRSAWR